MTKWEDEYDKPDSSYWDVIIVLVIVILLTLGVTAL